MNQRINPSWIRRLLAVAVLAAVVKSAMLVLAFFLPYQGVDYTEQEEAGTLRSGYRPSALFDLQVPQQEQSPGTQKSAPVYKLGNLLLRGIYYQNAHSFIAVEDSGKISLLSTGESFKGYRLVDILADRAIFEKGGRRYELAFKEDKRAETAITKASPIVFEGEPVTVKRKDLQYYTKNFKAIWENIKIQELMEDKKLKGFKVAWIKKDSIFGKMGLHKGDIIIGVNGKSFSSVAQVFKLYNKMDKLDSLTLKILRNNQERQLEYAIND